MKTSRAPNATDVVRVPLSSVLTKAIVTEKIGENLGSAAHHLVIKKLRKLLEFLEGRER